MPKTLTERKKIGNLGEEIAEMFLMKRGFSPMGRNYTRKWGEIDLIMEKKGKLHFVEVKTVSREIVSCGGGALSHGTKGVIHSFKDRLGLRKSREIVQSQTQVVTRVTKGAAHPFKDCLGLRESCEIIQAGGWKVIRETPRPEDNLHKWKLERLGRAIRTYLEERGFGERSWQLDAAIVYLDTEKKRAKVDVLEDIVIEDRA
jgi:Holliday junction resolvase-like predicted endonuclease